MAYTLISMLGTGMYEGGYKTTTYVFQDKKKFETKLFLEALLKCKYRDIKKLIIIGTKTSSWDILIDDKKDEDFWTDIYEKSSSQGIDEKEISQLQKYLSERLNLPVILKVHTDKIDDDSAEQIFECYNSIESEIGKDCDILFDITHGFRSMPLLAYQALQYSISTKDPDRKVEIVYGEYRKQEKLSYVRDLSNYWYYAQVSDALSIFETKLDGFRLAELIKEKWTSGAKAIKKLSEIVQTNFSLQIIDVARQIKNAMNDFPADAPTWLNKVKAALDKIMKCIDDTSLPRTLYNYSNYLYSLHLNVQAIITLQLVVETTIAVKFGINENIGDYDWWQNTGKEFLRKKKNKNFNELKSLHNLERFRNQIAHGGSKDREAKCPPNAANIPSIYESGLKGVEALFKILEI